MEQMMMQAIIIIAIQLMGLYIQALIKWNGAQTQAQAQAQAHTWDALKYISQQHTEQQATMDTMA